MARHATRIDGGTLYVESGDDWLEVGELSAIYDVVGGEQVEVEYDGREATFAEWLDVDDENVMTVDVRETLAEMTFPDPFVRRLADRPIDGAPPPARTRFFAETMAEVWRSKGNLGKENPFTEE